MCGVSSGRRVSAGRVFEEMGGTMNPLTMLTLMNAKDEKAQLFVLMGVIRGVVGLVALHGLLGNSKYTAGRSVPQLAEVAESVAEAMMKTWGLK